MSGPSTRAARSTPRRSRTTSRGTRRPRAGAGALRLARRGAIEALIDAAFWASLQREEGYAPEISLAFLPPERAVRPLLLRRAAAARPARARAPRARGRAPRHPPRASGATRASCGSGARRARSRRFCFVVEVLGPGLLVVKHRVREDSAKFRNVAVFEGEQVKILSRDGRRRLATIPPC